MFVSFVSLFWRGLPCLHFQICPPRCLLSQKGAMGKRNCWEQGSPCWHLLLSFFLSLLSRPSFVSFLQLKAKPRVSVFCVDSGFVPEPVLSLAVCLLCFFSFLARFSFCIFFCIFCFHGVHHCKRGCREKETGIDDGGALRPWRDTGQVLAGPLSGEPCVLFTGWGASRCAGKRSFLL